MHTTNISRISTICIIIDAIDSPVKCARECNEQMCLKIHSLS